MFGENLVPSSCRHLLRWRCKLERRLALFMGADSPLQVSWLLEFRAFALGTGELVTKSLEFDPARLLIANGSGSVGIVLVMASEIFHLALLQRYDETVAGRLEEHQSELQPLMRSTTAVF